MKAVASLLTVSLLVSAGCSTTHQRARSDSETVMVSYHVRPGKEAEFQPLLARAWQVYRGENMTYAHPHILIRDVEDGDKTKFVEIFTWIKPPDHAPESVQTIWKQEHVLCEARNGKQGIEGGEVELITGP